MILMQKHVADLQLLGSNEVMTDSFSKTSKQLEDEGYENSAVYTGTDGSAFEGKGTYIICSNTASGLRLGKVITPSQDSAAIYSICGNCDAQYVDTAIRQKALGRLLKKRNTRQN
jgi:hypothetical protein